MFYETGPNNHGLPHDPFKAIVAPRPIGWIGTKGRGGSRNLGPYSFFNVVSERPKIVMFSSSGAKHSLRNAEETGVFTASLVGRSLVERMNASSAMLPYGEDEFAFAGLTPRDGTLVDAPYVSEAYAALECRVTDIMRPKTLDGSMSDCVMVFGQVVGVHLDETAIVDGRVDMTLVRPVGRMGYMDYCDGGEPFEILRPPRV